MYYVYILADKGIPFYVGKGKGDRAYIHEKIAMESVSRQVEFGLVNDYNPHRTRKIRKIRAEGRKIEYLFPFKSDNEDAVLAEERRLIELYGRSNLGGILTNIHPGGTGGNIWAGLPKERQEEIREKHRGRIHSEETIARIRQASTGRSHTDETKQKISRARAGKSNGPSSKKGMPATGKNQKGIREAWNKDLPKDDPQAISHRSAIQKWHSENKELVRQHRGTPYRLIDPDGNLVEGVGIPSLTENYDVSTKIRGLILGRVDSYKGWKRAD